MKMDFKRKLPIPMVLKEMYPLSEELKEIKAKNDEEIRDIFTGKSNKFLVIVGPCSADRIDAVIDYLKRLRKIYDEVSDVITIVPRVYTNKPRSLSGTYQGMLHQPDPKASPDMYKGLVAIRNLHMKVLEETHFSSADEMLYPENHKYIDDLLSYVAVGARSVENQMHRLTASGLEVPVGMKNPTSGDLDIMLNAIDTAEHPHTFIYRGWEAESYGNELSHGILRGYIDELGNSVPNYDYDTLLKLTKVYNDKNYKNPAIIVDCNHCNSNKDCFKQIDIAKDVIHSIGINSDIKKLVKGLMIESYMLDGNQKIEDSIYGKSITDPCLGIEKTEKLLKDIANELRKMNK